MILDTITAGVRCPACGAPECACGSRAREDALATAARPVMPPALPLANYPTFHGNFRYSPAAAILAGLLPDPNSNALAHAVVRRLPIKFRRPAADAYQHASDTARATFLTGVAMLSPQQLPGAAGTLIAQLESAK
jgi:hypothetical protein